MLIYIDGEFFGKDDAKISVFDHGLLYGDGVFEGLRAYNGKTFRLDTHIERLYDSAKAILLDIPLEYEKLKEDVLATLDKNGLKDAYIRIIVTRGKGDLGLDPNNCSKASIIIIVDKLKLYPQDFYEKGLAIITSSVRRNVPDALNPRIKSLNYLNNIMAKIEAKQANALEAIMLSRDGYVCECTGDNIFVCENDVLKTPPVHAGALKGITRGVVLELADELGIKVKEERITQYDLYTATESFLTGSGAEIIPVVEIDSRRVGTGKPGEITRRLMSAFKKLVQSY